MALCKNPRCRELLTPTNRSSDSDGYCTTCGNLVYAFRPDSELFTEWLIVTELTDGSFVGGAQCGVCGLSLFTLRQRTTYLWVAVCEGQEWDGEEINGCQTEHPVRQKKAMDVIF